jgi:outer membrane protein OmpA-like peptidoglycan-associated protein
MKRRTITWLLGICTVLPAFAQTPEPSTEQMIEQLKVPKTRSLRNFLVELAPGPSVNASADSKEELEQTAAQLASQTARPSLSLLILFDFNSARVRPESRQALINLAQALQSAELTGSKFAVEGHTDAKGSVEFNQKLSEQRALAVREFLKARGVDEVRLMATGKGSADLANSAQPFAAENRRVRIVNLE